MVENCKKDKNLYSLLLFIDGIFSTFQIIQVAGTTVFSELMLISVVYLLVKDKNISIKKNDGFVWKYIILISISELMIFTIKLRNSSEWKNSSLKKYIILVLVMLFFYVIEKNYETRVRAFVKGLHVSCLIQVFWCYLQFILEKWRDIDINQMFFSVSQYNLTGQKVITGLHVNAGILAPTIIFLVFYDRRWWVKLLSILIFFIAGTSTMLICGCTVIVLYGVHHLSLHHKRSISKKNFIEIALIVILVILGIIVLSSSQKDIFERILDMFESMGDRIGTIKDKQFTDGSTFVHTRYYTSLFTIMSSLGIMNILFGFGIGCAGVPFVEIFNQYPQLIYVPESDIMAYIYDVGIIGFVAFYILFIMIIKKGKKIDWHYMAFMIVILVGGVFYGMQLNWVILFEWICMSCINNKKNIFDLYDTGKRCKNE